jgi:hypothetical protein
MVDINQWRNILAGCSKIEARFILFLQYMLYAMWSKLFFFIFLFLIIGGISSFYYYLNGVSNIIFLGSALIQILLFKLLDKILFNDREIELAEIKNGIQEINNYINKKSYE